MPDSGHATPTTRVILPDAAATIHVDQIHIDHKITLTRTKRYPSVITHNDRATAGASKLRRVKDLLNVGQVDAHLTEAVAHNRFARVCLISKSCERQRQNKREDNDCEIFPHDNLTEIPPDGSRQLPMTVAQRAIEHHPGPSVVGYSLRSESLATSVCFFTQTGHWRYQARGTDGVERRRVSLRIQPRIGPERRSKCFPGYSMSSNRPASK